MSTLNCILRLALFTLGTGAILACGDDASLSPGRDCRLDGYGCPAGSACEPSPSGGYLCMPGQRDTDSAPRTPVQDMFVNPAGDTGGSGGTGGTGAVGGGGAGGQNMEGSGGNAGMPTGPGGNSGSGGTGGGSAPPSGCEDARLLLKPSAGNIARVYIVVDRSYSMVERVDRWTPVTEAIENVTQALDGVVQFGLILFPDPYPEAGLDDAARSCAPGRVNVPVGHGTSAEIVRWMTSEAPRFGLATPTASALQTAGDALSENRTENDYILLATDGGPGCNFALDYENCPCLNGASCLLFEMPQNCLDRERTVTVARNLVSRWGIKTFVLGLTDENFLPAAREVLDEMAVAGQTAVNGRHFEVGRLDTLQQALMATAGGLVPCIYDLGEVVRFADRLQITIDGQVIPRDPAQSNGWSVVNGEIEFSGDACAQLRDGRAHEVRAECQ